MFDGIWIIFNILMWILFIVLFLGVIIWLIKKSRLEVLVILSLALLIVFSNNKNTNQSSRVYSTEAYSDIIRLNAFQKDYFHVDTYNDIFEYSSSVSGMMAGIYWDNAAFYGEKTDENKIRYSLKKKKKYMFLNIPVFSRIVTFEGMAEITKH